MKEKQPCFPEIIEKSEDEVRTIILLVEQSALPDDIKRIIIKCVETAMWLPLYLEQKNISLQRLKRMIFGKGYKKKIIALDDNQENKSTENGGAPANDETTSQNAGNELATSHKQLNANLPSNTSPGIAGAVDKPKKPGHGRNPYTAYNANETIHLELSNLTAGDACPALCGGKLSYYKPGNLIRIKGQNFAQVHHYVIDKLRCGLCGLILAEDIPASVGEDKYDPAFKSILALMKYYLAIPFYRQEYFQRLLHFPLPDSTQWDLIEQVAGNCYPVFNALKREAANGKLIHNDDTRVLILEVIAQIKASAPARTGMYTSGFIAENEGHKIALFINGQQHAGENLENLLKQRTKSAPIIQMCDALSANIPKELQTILCNCLSHGFRKFDELKDFYPEQCVIIMKMLGAVFKYDELTQTMLDDERLAYHQQHSAPIMTELATYMAALLSEHLIEPNSEMGKAIRYMQKHWEKLTRFLTVAGAPIDNNILEGALKIPIRNRKSAMFYRTCYSAYIGGMITSIIYTCHLSNINPLDYLIALQHHRVAILKAPKQWLPWNYQQTMAAAIGANPMANAPSSACPAAA